MKERLVEIPTPNGRMETFITHPEEGGPFPAVIVYMDFWGVREELYEIARRIGTVGYYCLVPDLYYRQGRVRFEFRDENNRMMSMGRIGDENLDKVLAAMRQLSNDMVMRDTSALLDFLDAGEPVRPGAVGAVGYCMGGRHVLCAAGHFPNRFRASACLHGTRIMSEREDSPHLVAAAFEGEVYCGYGENDPYTPPELVQGMDRLLQSCGVEYRYEVHAAAEHGYALPDRDIFDRHAAARDWEIIFAMFRRQLQPDSA